MSNMNEGIPVFSYERVVVTGASGWLAQELVSTLRKRGHCRIVGVSRSSLPFVDGLERMSNRAFLDEFKFLEGDVLIHCAFERGSDGKGLADSLEYSGICFQKAIGGRASVINISSQAVYGSKNGPRSLETAPLAPDYLYALAKASSEMMLESIWDVSGSTGYRTSLRLASLMGVSGGKTPGNVLGKFVDSAIEGRPICITGGDQRFSFLDIHDAVEAIVSILNLECTAWKSAYNVTPDNQIGIVDMAELIATTVSRRLGVEPVRVILRKSDALLNPGGDNSLIKADTGWRQERSMKRIVEDVVEFKLAKRGVRNG